MLGAAAWAQGTAEATAYRLGIGDEVRLTVQDQPQASGQATIVDDGVAALPLIDELHLAGLTLREATAAIRQVVAAKFVNPVVTLAVSRYRPIFVLGDVANPGLYPWFPGATVAQSVAVAGGYRVGRGDYLQTVVAGIRAAEALADARYDLAVARVQQARINTEIDGKTVLAAPPADDPSSRPLIDQLTAREQVVLDTRVTGFAKQLDLLAREQATRSDEMAALSKRIKTQADQDQNLRNEIANVQLLISHGNAPVTRLNELFREQSRLQGDVMQTQVLLNQARSGRNQAELQAANVTRDRRIQLLAELQESESRIQRLRQQLRAETSILIESTTIQGQPGGDAITTRFSLQGKGEAAIRAADENAAVAPGDILRIERSNAPSASSRLAADCEPAGLGGPCPGCRDGRCHMANDTSAAVPGTDGGVSPAR